MTIIVMVRGEDHVITGEEATTIEMVTEAEMDKAEEMVEEEIKDRVNRVYI